MNEIIKTNEEENNAEIKPWSHKEGEPEEAYKAFEFFLALGLGRSLDMMSKSCGFSIDKLKKWSARWDWASRTKLYDVLKLDMLKNEVLTDIDIRNRRIAQKKYELTVLTEDAYLDLVRYMESYWSHYQNPDAMKKIRFVKSLSSALSSLLKASQFNLSARQQSDLAERDVKINNVLNLNNDMRQVNIEKTTLYNYFNVLGSEYENQTETEDRYPGNVDIEDENPNTCEMD